MTDLTLEMLRAELAPLRSDLTFVRNHSVLLGRAVETLQHEVRQIKTAVNDLATLQMTAGEAEALHSDIDQVITKQRELEARIMTLEQMRGAQP